MDAIINFFANYLAVDDTFELVGRIVLPIAFFGTPYIAYRKGRNPLFWFMLFLLLQPIALIAILLTGKQKKCVHCGKRMDENLMECPFCMKEQPAPETSETK